MGTLQFHTLLELNLVATLTIDLRYIATTLFGSPKPFLRRLGLEVHDISLEGTLRVNYSMSWWCPKSETESVANLSLASSPFFFLKIEKHIHCHGLWQLVFFNLVMA